MLCLKYFLLVEDSELLYNKYRQKKKEVLPDSLNFKNSCLLGIAVPEQLDIHYHQQNEYQATTKAL